MTKSRFIRRRAVPSNVSVLTLLHHKVCQNWQRVHDSKGSIELYCLFIEAGSISDAIKSIWSSVVWSETKLSPNPAKSTPVPTGFEVRVVESGTTVKSGVDIKIVCKQFAAMMQHARNVCINSL